MFVDDDHDDNAGCHFKTAEMLAPRSNIEMPQFTAAWLA